MAIVFSKPKLKPALMIGLITVVAPLMMGGEYFAISTTNPVFAIVEKE